MNSDNPYCLGIEQILKFLPHRAPFLLVDRILEIHPSGPLDDLSPQGKIGTKVVGLKNATFNEPFFPGHFPGFPIFPGVLLVEVMAQVSSFASYPYLLAKKGPNGVGDLQCLLLGVDDVRFRRPVVPGDTLRVESTVSRCRGSLWTFDCKVMVEGKVVADGQIMANFGPNGGKLG